MKHIKFEYSTLLKWLFTAFSLILLFVIFVYDILIGHKYYAVWSAEMKGKARLMESSQSKQIMIETAKAEVEATTLRTNAIEIIGKKAKEYPEYRMQEFIGTFGEALNNDKKLKIPKSRVELKSNRCGQLHHKCHKIGHFRFYTFKNCF